MNGQKSLPFLSGSALKMLAAACMLLDHIAWYLLPFSSPLAQIFHTFGRITMPVMCFFLAQGFLRTHSVCRYLLRLLVFALIAQAPWWVLHRSGDFSLNTLFTLFLCLLMLYILAADASPVLRVGGAALCFAATYFCDWAFYAPAWCLIFYFCRGNRRKTALLFCAVGAVYCAESFLTKGAAGFSPRMALLSSMFTLGVFLALPLLFLPQKGNRPSRFSKWFFYVFYPAHLAVIALIQFLIAK